MVLFSLTASLVYAMLVIPAMEIKFIHLDTDARQISRFERGQIKFFSILQNAYNQLQDICFKHPYITIMTGLASIAVGILMFLALNVQMMPMAERDCFAIEIRLPEGSSLNETTAVSDSLQKMLLQDERITGVTAFIGESAPRFHVTYAPSMPAKNLAQLIVNTRSVKATEELLPLLDIV